MNPKKSKEEILVEYEKASNKIIQELMAILDQAEQKVIKKEYQTTLNKLK